MDMSFLSAYGMKIVMEDIVVNVMFMTRLDMKKHDFLDWKVMHSYVVINGIPICNCLCSHKNHVFYSWRALPNLKLDRSPIQMNNGNLLLP